MSLEKAKREKCTEKYPNHVDVPWENCVFCIARTTCGKPKPEETEDGYDA